MILRDAEATGGDAHTISMARVIVGMGGGKRRLSLREKKKTEKEDLGS